MLKKLRWQFILVNMAIIACMLLAIFALVVRYMDVELKRESESALHNLAYGYADSQDVRMPHLVIQLHIDGSANISGSSHFDLKDDDFIQKLINRVYKKGETAGFLEEYELQYVVVSGMMSHRMIFVDVSGHRAAMDSLIQGCWIIGVLALGLFFVISMLLARWAVKPVEKAWDQQKQFVSDASHELKTPLTVIMSNAELLQSPDFDEEQRTQFTSSILTMAHHMRHLVEGMLELARSDNGQSKMVFEKLDLSKCVADALLPFDPVFFEKGLVLENEIQPDITLRGSESHLRQVLDILLDNAAKYSAKGIVRVKLASHGRSHCLLTVANPGQPIPQSELQKIFERFYRVDAARSRDGSFGLGLPIAKTIVREHGGKIWAVSNETGNCFCVLLPCNIEK